MRHQIVAAALLLSSTAALDVNRPLSMTVSPVQSMAPTTLTVRVQVEPDAINRRLEVVVDSGEYYRSSDVQLDGVDGPSTISLEFRNVPGGEYDVRGSLITTNEKPRAVIHQHAIVIGAAR